MKSCVITQIMSYRQFQYVPSPKELLQIIIDLKQQSDYFDYKDYIISMNLSNHLNLNNDDQDSDETPFFEHNTARVSIFEDEVQTQSAFNIFNHEPRESKQKSFISKLQIFERNNNDIEEKHRSINPIAQQYLPMTGGRQLYQRETRQNSKQKELFQSRVRDTNEKDKPFYLKKQSTEKDKFSFKPSFSENISFQSMDQKNHFQEPDSNMSRKTSKDKEQSFYYTRVQSNFKQAHPPKKEQQKITVKETRINDKQQRPYGQSKGNHEKPKFLNLSVKQQDQNQNNSKTNFIFNLRKSRAQQKGTSLKGSMQNVLKDYKPIKPLVTAASIPNKNEEIRSTKIQISPKLNDKTVQSVPKAVSAPGDLVKKLMLQTNPNKTEKKLHEGNTDDFLAKTSMNSNKLPPLVSSRVRLLPVEGNSSDSSSNESLPKQKQLNQKSKPGVNNARKEEQIHQSSKKNSENFALGLKDKLKTFGGPTQKLQIKSIANTKAFQLKPKAFFLKEPSNETAHTPKDIQPQKPKFQLKQKDVKSSLVAEVPKRQSKLQKSFLPNKCDFSKYMVQVTVMLVEIQNLKARCNRTRNAFREMAILSNVINQKINKIIKTN